MSLHVGLRRAVPPGGHRRLFGTAGAPPDGNPETFAAEVKSRPPVLLVHGDRDDLIPPQALFQAMQGLAALGVPAEWHMSAGVGHGIDPDGLRHGGEFLARSSRPDADALRDKNSRAHCRANFFVLNCSLGFTLYHNKQT